MLCIILLTALLFCTKRIIEDEINRLAMPSHMLSMLLNIHADDCWCVFWLTCSLKFCSGRNWAVWFSEADSGSDPSSVLSKVGRRWRTSRLSIKGFYLNWLGESLCLSALLHRGFLNSIQHNQAICHPACSLLHRCLPPDCLINLTLAHCLTVCQCAVDMQIRSESTCYGGALGGFRRWLNRGVEGKKESWTLFECCLNLLSSFAC